MKNLSLSRREMLASSAAMSLAALAGPSISLASTGTQKRVPGVAGIGYQEVEFAGYGDQSVQQIRRLLDDLDLQSPSSHMDARRLRENAAELIELAAAIGHDYVTIAWLNPEDRQTIDDYKGWAETFNRVGEACRDSGMRLAYHNHDFEFEPLDGQLPFDVLLDETDADLVDFELDFFWVRKAGQDIVPVLNKAPERFTMAHIKDMDTEGEMADVGAGVIDFANILGDEAASGLRHLFVEHDQPADPFKSVAISRLALSSILD